MELPDELKLHQLVRLLPYEIKAAIITTLPADSFPRASCAATNLRFLKIPFITEYNRIAVRLTVNKFLNEKCKLPAEAFGSVHILPDVGDPHDLALILREILPSSVHVFCECDLDTELFMEVELIDE